MTITRQLIEALAEWNSCEERPRQRNDRRRSSRAPTLAPPSEDEPSRALARTIEGEVIPRLMLAHRLANAPAMAGLREMKHATASDVAELTRIVLEHDTPVAESFIDALRNQGLPVDAIYMELLAPTARLLGEMWKADLCDFTDVTIGLSRLQQIVIQIGAEREQESGAGQSSEGCRIFLVPALDEQHTLGLMLVEEQFRRSGWECCSCAPRSEKDLVRMVKSQHFDVIGLSASSEVLLDSVASAIQAMRKASSNPGVVVLVGGGIFLDNPQYVSRVGADGTAEDGRHAVAQMRRLLETRLKGR